MPFSEVYAVNFANGNFLPHVNLMSWPAMQRFPAADTQDVQQVADPDGLVLKISRTNPASAAVLNSVLVAPPGGLTPGVRIMTRVTFDLPFAAGIPNPNGGGTTFPEAWAVALANSQGVTLAEVEAVHLTCQFFRRGSRNGVRLNTPSGIQKDQAALLVEPIDYNSFQGLPNPPHGPANNPPGLVPLFTLEHSFSDGRDGGLSYLPGWGSLRIYRNPQYDKSDHRVYVTDDLIAGPLLAAGVTVVTLSALGRMQARLRTFSVLINTPLA